MIRASFVLFCLGILVAVPACVSAQAAPAAPPSEPLSAPSIFPRHENILRPVPSILPTLRSIDSEMLPLLVFKLNLTDDQKAKAQGLLAKSDDEQKPKIEAQNKAAQEYIALLGKPDAKQADLLAAAQNVFKAEGEIMAVRIGALIALRAMLTPEQNKKLSDALEQPSRRWLRQPDAPPVTPPTPPPTDK